MAFWIWGIIVFLLDRWTKFLVVQKMNIGETIPIVQDFLHITYIKNPGAAFGILAEKTWFFISVTIAILMIIIYFNYTLSKGNVRLAIIFGLVAGGAVGNLFDRLQSGLVVDFIDIRAVWPYIFNLADAAIVVGMLLLAWQILTSEKLKD